MKSYPAQETVRHFTVGWSLLRCSLLYALGPLMNIKHSQQVISLLSTPFILAHLQKLPGVTGERAEKSGSGFHLPGVAGACFGSFLLRRKCLVHVCYLNVKCLAKEKKQKFNTDRGISSGSTGITLTVFLPRQQRENRGRRWEHRHSKGAFQKHTLNSSHTEEPAKLNQTTGGDTLSKHKNPSSLLCDPKFLPLCSQPLRHWKCCWMFYISTRWF